MVWYCWVCNPPWIEVTLWIPFFILPQARIVFQSGLHRWLTSTWDLWSSVYICHKCSSCYSRSLYRVPLLWVWQGNLVLCWNQEVSGTLIAAPAWSLLYSDDHRNAVHCNYTPDVDGRVRCLNTRWIAFVNEHCSNCMALKITGAVTLTIRIQRCKPLTDLITLPLIKTIFRAG